MPECDCYEFSHVARTGIGGFASQTGKNLAVRESFSFWENSRVILHVFYCRFGSVQ